MGFFAFFGGLVLAVTLGIGLAVLLMMVAIGGNALEWLASTGLVQWLYLIPMSVRYFKKDDKLFAAGLLVGGGLVFLLVSACYGLLTGL